MNGKEDRQRRLGVHTSVAGGLPLSLERASALGCSTLQIFSHNPRAWAVKDIPPADVTAFRRIRTRLDLSPVFIHASYLINMASADSELKRKSVELLRIEMERADLLSADYVVLHGGASLGDDARAARKRSIQALNEVSSMNTWKAGLLIENTAGETGGVSSGICDLAEMLEGVGGRLLAGICLDTCHAYAAGYDIRVEGGKALAGEIERLIGIASVKLIHLNDSKGSAGSGLDRHEHIGHGKIGCGALKRFINLPRLLTVPLILETPKKRDTDDPMNLGRVRRMILEH